MGRRRLAVLLAIVIAGNSVFFARVFAPDRYDAATSGIEPFLSDVPEQVVFAGITLGLLVTWAAGMVLLAKLLYWVWRQIDEYVFWVWNLVVPESPIIQFGVGLIVLLVLFVFGPLVVIQSIDFTEGEEDNVEESLNETTPDNETTPTDESSLSESLAEFESTHTGQQSSVSGTGVG